MARWSILRPLSMKFVGNVRGYSPQQYQEELEHFDFFDSYFRDEPLSEIELPGSYITFFDELTKDFESGDIQRIVTRFHLVTEGILATTGLNILRSVGERYGLTQFTRGIKRIIEDEARHINFGLGLITDKGFALRRLNEIYPEAVKIVSDGRVHLEALTPFNEIMNMMEELRRARETRLKG